MDSWRSWLVLACGFTVLFLSFGSYASYSLNQVELQMHFQSSEADVVLVGSITYGVTCFCGPLANFLYQVAGSRITVSIGGVIASMGYLMSSFSPNLCQVVIGHAIVGKRIQLRNGQFAF